MFCRPGCESSAAGLNELSALLQCLAAAMPFLVVLLQACKCLSMLWLQFLLLLQSRALFEHVPLPGLSSTSACFLRSTPFLSFVTWAWPQQPASSAASLVQVGADKGGCSASCAGNANCYHQRQGPGESVRLCGLARALLCRQPWPGHCWASGEPVSACAHKE